MDELHTEAFCIGCHEMRTTVFEEMKSTIHYSNRSGVRATCPDCHVPHGWTDRMARKMQASTEVWGKIVGTIDTRAKFLDRRLTLAEHEWARLKANDSLECRNCHQFYSMDLTRQSARAAAVHERWLLTGEKTCIDCHKGIAHRLPNMASALKVSRSNRFSQANRSGPPHGSQQIRATHLWSAIFQLGPFRVLSGPA